MIISKEKYELLAHHLRLPRGQNTTNLITNESIQLSFRPSLIMAYNVSLCEKCGAECVTRWVDY
jgi:hypothetical protein